MKSIKKQFKQRVTDIHQFAHELSLISDDLNLFKEFQAVINQAIQACEALQQTAVDLDKNDFIEQIVEHEALVILDEITDIDAISSLEDRLFAIQGEQADSEFGLLLQQLLEKLEKRYTPMVEAIQQLTALLDAE